MTCTINPKIKSNINVQKKGMKAMFLFSEMSFKIKTMLSVTVYST
jgi:hypothetical protein